MPEIIRKYFVNETLADPYIFKEADKEFKVYPFVLSTEALDRQFEKVKLSNESIKNFKKNPQMFLNHDSRALPIGEWKNIRIADGKLLADAWFHGLDEVSQLIETYVDAKQLRAASIGFQSLKRKQLEPDEKDKDLIKDNTWAGTITLHERIDILEASIVSLPANPEALAGKNMLTDEQTKSIEDLFEPEQEKAGAVLSQKNKNKLKDAVTSIQSVIEEADKDTRPQLEEGKDFKDWYHETYYIDLSEYSKQIEELRAEINDLKTLLTEQANYINEMKALSDVPVTEPKPQKVKISLTEYLKKKSKINN